MLGLAAALTHAREAARSPAAQLMKPYAEEERPYACVETDEASACMVCLDCEGQAREYHHLVKVRHSGGRVSALALALVDVTPAVARASLQVSEKKQLFNFVVESTGSLRPELIVLRSIEVLRRKLKDVRANLRNAEEVMEES
jgi:hypothetical protein